MRVVEVLATRSAALTLLGYMREWLDSNVSKAARLEIKRNGPAIVIKARFDQDEMAERFRRAFQGSYST